MPIDPRQISIVIGSDRAKHPQPKRIRIEAIILKYGFHLLFDILEQCTTILRLRRSQILAKQIENSPQIIALFVIPDLRDMLSEDQHQTRTHRVALSRANAAPFLQPAPQLITDTVRGPQKYTDADELLDEPRIRVLARLVGKRVRLPGKSVLHRGLNLDFTLQFPQPRVVDLERNMHRLIVSPIMPFNLACGLEVTTVPAIRFQLFVYSVHVRVEWTDDCNSDDVRNIIDRKGRATRDFSQFSPAQLLSAKAI